MPSEAADEYASVYENICKLGKHRLRNFLWRCFFFSLASAAAYIL